MSMLSALARSPMGRKLLKFTDDNNLKEDWESPSASNVEAYVSGKTLDNQFPAEMLVEDEVNDELLIHLQSPHGRCIVNLTTVLALASAYIRGDFDRAEVMVGHFHGSKKAADQKHD